MSTRKFVGHDHEDAVWMMKDQWEKGSSWEHVCKGSTAKRKE